MCNQIPIKDLLNDPTYPLPSWAPKHQAFYTAFARHSNEISKALIRHLEAPLGLVPDTLASMPCISTTNGGFVRMLRYSAPDPSAPSPSDVTNPPHADCFSVTILFSWQEGLQIARPRKGSITKIAANNGGEDWLWVKPLPGFAVVKIEGPLDVFVNGVLRSALHRFVTPPGEQARSHGYGVLADLRPKGETEMNSLRSEMIP